jgi:predicted chitinase
MANDTKKDEELKALRKKKAELNLTLKEIVKDIGLESKVLENFRREFAKYVHLGPENNLYQKLKKQIKQSEEAVLDFEVQRLEISARRKEAESQLRKFAATNKKVGKSKEQLAKEQATFEKTLDKLNKEIIKTLPENEAVYESLSIQFEKERDEFEKTNKNLSGYYKQSQRIVNQVIASARNDQTIKNLRINLKTIKEQRKIVELTYDKGVERDKVLQELQTAEGAVNKTLERKSAVLTRSLDFVKKQEGNILAIVSGVISKSPIVMWGISALDDMMKGLDDEQAKQAKIKSELLEQHRNAHGGSPSGGRRQVSSDESGWSGTGGDGVLSELREHTRLLNQLLGVDEKMEKSQKDMAATQRTMQEEGESAAGESKIESGLKAEIFPNAKPADRRKKDKSGPLSFLSNIWKSLDNIIDVLLVGKLAGVGKLFTSVFTKIKTFAKTLPRLLGIVGGVLTAIYNVLDGYTSSKRWGVDKIEAMLSTQLIPAVLGLVAGPVGFLVGELIQMALPDSFKAAMAGTLQDIADGLETLWTGLELAFKWIVNSMEGIATSVSDFFEDTVLEFSRLMLDLEIWFKRKSLQMTSVYRRWIYGKDSVDKADKEIMRLENERWKLDQKRPAAEKSKQDWRHKRDAWLEKKHQARYDTSRDRLDRIRNSRSQRANVAANIEQRTQLENARTPEGNIIYGHGGALDSNAIPGNARNNAFLNSIGYGNGAAMPAQGRQQITAGPAIATVPPDLSKVPQGKLEMQKALVTALAKEGITDPKAVSNIFAQVEHEGSGWGPKDEGKSQYASSRGLYKGRGLIQLTNDFNYKEMTQALKERGINADLVNHPELANDPKLMPTIAAAYFKIREKRGDLTNVQDVNRLMGYNKGTNSGRNAGTGGANDMARARTAQNIYPYVQKLMSENNQPAQMARNQLSSEQGNWTKLMAGGMNPLEAITANGSTEPVAPFTPIVNRPTEYAAANTANSNAKIGATVSAGASKGGSPAGKVAVAGGKAAGGGGGGGTGAGRAAPRGNEAPLQMALNTDFSGSTA